jgi:hypothetical protein
MNFEVILLGNPTIVYRQSTGEDFLASSRFRFNCFILKRANGFAVWRLGRGSPVAEQKSPKGRPSRRIFSKVSKKIRTLLHPSNKQKCHKARKRCGVLYQIAPIVFIKLHGTLKDAVNVLMCEKQSSFFLRYLRQPLSFWTRDSNGPLSPPYNHRKHNNTDSWPFLLKKILYMI